MTTILHDTILRTLCAAGIFAGLAVALPTAVLAQDESQQQDAQEESGLAAYAATAEPPLFDEPAAVVDAFKAALEANDVDATAKLLGLDAERLKDDESAADTFVQIRDGAANQLIIKDMDDRKILQVGAKLWPLPFPIVKGEDGKWAFDTYAGLEEIVNRRVGENELEAIATVGAYVEAQKDYAEQDRDGDGVQEFAQKLISAEGGNDGLYWPADEVNGESPAGDLNGTELEDAAEGGYFGYRFKILTGQGDRIAGGSYDYVINDNMIGGFALVAWPVKYAETGVHTFAVNQHGIIYEADLGPATETIVKYIDRFNPDDGWSVAD